MIPSKDIIRLVAQNKNLHVMCRSIARGVDEQWKHFVDGKWLLTLPEFDKGFPEKIKFEHRRDPNVLYFGPYKKALSQDWRDAKWLQGSIDSLLGADKWCFTAKNFAIPVQYPLELGDEGLMLDKWRWTFDSKGFMPLILKHEPFDISTLQAFHTDADKGLFGSRATRIVSPHREFYVMMEEI